MMRVSLRNWRSSAARIVRLAATTAAIWLVSAIAVDAQIKPLSSGQPSFNAPQMRRHHSGLYRPNRPHRHHRRHRHRPSFFPR